MNVDWEMLNAPPRHPTTPHKIIFTRTFEGCNKCVQSDVILGVATPSLVSSRVAQPAGGRSYFGWA